MLSLSLTFFSAGIRGTYKFQTIAYSKHNIILIFEPVDPEHHFGVGWGDQENFQIGKLLKMSLNFC